MVMDYALIERYFDWRVEQLIMDGEWKIPIEMYKCFAKDDLPVFGNGADKKVWSGDIIGKFYVASAVQMIIDKIMFFVGLNKYGILAYIHMSLSY